MVLVSSISNFFNNKISQGRKLSAKKIPTCNNSALEHEFRTKFNLHLSVGYFDFWLHKLHNMLKNSFYKFSQIFVNFINYKVISDKIGYFFQILRPPQNIRIRKKFRKNNNNKKSLFMVYKFLKARKTKKSEFAVEVAYNSFFFTSCLQVLLSDKTF